MRHGCVVFNQNLVEVRTMALTPPYYLKISAPRARQDHRYALGRGCGVGRGLGAGVPLGVGVGRGVELGVGVAVGVGVTEGVAVGVGVGVGVGPEGVMLKGSLVDELSWKRTSLAMTRTRTSAMPEDGGSCQS